jgi:hypothetical protein
MRACIFLLLVSSAAIVRAQVPAPGAPHPADQPAADAASVPVPAGAQERRNWLLARLIVDQDFDRDKVRSIEQGLAQMSPDQLDVLVRVYKERWEQRKAVEQTQLEEARANLEQMKSYRDAVAQNLDYLRAFRQAQYLSFGNWYGGLGGFGRLGYGGYGYGGGWAGYGGYGYGGLGYGGIGYSGAGYGNFGYGPAYAYPAYGYGMGMPGYGGAYPTGGFMNGMGAGY